MKAPNAFIIFLLVVLTGGASGQGVRSLPTPDKDPFVGTWKANRDKSQPKLNDKDASYVRTIAREGDELVFSSHTDNRVGRSLMPPKVATRLFYLWLVLLLPCFFLAPLSLMAIGDAPGPKANVLVWSLWTYPVAVGIVGFLKKKKPMIALLPCLNIAACIVSGL